MYVYLKTEGRSYDPGCSGKVKVLYVRVKTGGRSYDHGCSGKVTSIAYTRCVFVALRIQHAMRVRHICGLSGCTISPHYQKPFDLRRKEQKVTEHKRRVLIFSTTFV